MAASGLNALYRFAVPAAIGVGLLQNSIYDVKGGSRAVIFDRISGVKETVINEGTHFLVPWLQKAIVFDVRTKARTIGTTTGSKDLQMVSLTLRVLHRPDVQALPKIYQVTNFLPLPPPLPFPTNTNTKTSPLLSPSAKTTTSVSSLRSATKSSRPSSPSSMPRSLSPSARPYPTASGRICSSEPRSSTSPSRTCPSPT